MKVELDILRQIKNSENERIQQVVFTRCWIQSLYFI